ncbi:cartilage matrix protein-like [Ostrea edulis]|uniref:cartilage matrix protein-like n=1 Tax=Ostrea edulis TaxID=37623 RepID=UPI0024AFC1AF|nr:cartilage matrix protein-like [Ostrea edulis]
MKRRKPCHFTYTWILIFICLLICGVKCEYKDIVFLLDSSGSISPGNFEEVVDFVSNVTSWLTIGPNETLVSVVTYASNVTEHFSLATYTSSSDAISAIQSLKSITPEGGTYTHLALNYSYEHSFGVRNGSSKAVVVLTDGRSVSRTETEKAADDLRSMEVEVYAVGVRSDLSLTDLDLQVIANDPDSYYITYVDDFVYLCNVVPGIVSKLDASAVANSVQGCPEMPTTTSSSKVTEEATTTTDSTTTTTIDASTTGMAILSSNRRISHRVQ